MARIGTALIGGAAVMGVAIWGTTSQKAKVDSGPANDAATLGIATPSAASSGQSGSGPTVRYLVESTEMEPCIGQGCYVVNEEAPSVRCPPHCYTLDEWKGSGPAWRLTDSEPALSCPPHCRYYRVTFEDGYPCTEPCRTTIELIEQKPPPVPDPAPAAAAPAIRYLVEASDMASWKGAGYFVVNEVLPPLCPPRCYTLDEYQGTGTAYQVVDREPSCPPNCRYYRVTFEDGYPCEQPCRTTVELVERQP